MPPHQPPDQGTRFVRLAWILLDWAGSAFSTVLITLVVAYVERVAFADRPWGLAPGVPGCRRGGDLGWPPR